jgi:hypothetical protein
MAVVGGRQARPGTWEALQAGAVPVSLQMTAIVAGPRRAYTGAAPAVPMVFPALSRMAAPVASPLSVATGV